MKVTIFRNKKDGSGKSLRSEELSNIFESIKTGANNKDINKLREDYFLFGNPESSDVYKRIPQVCPVAEFGQKKTGEKVFRNYNGVTILHIKGLVNGVEMAKIKRKVAQMPQTLAVFEGADGHSVVILCIAKLPDLSLPKGEKEALLFAVQAYSTAILCYQPMLERNFEIIQPTLEDTFAMTYDPEIYVNATAVPFIIQQPSDISLHQLTESSVAKKVLEEMTPGAESYITNTKIYNAAFQRALISLNWTPSCDRELLLERVIDECCSAGLPQEEITVRLARRFSEHEKEDIRTMVENAYMEKLGTGLRLPMTKHQIVAYRLREFLNRRYDIRYNEVLQMTEYRERYSLMFLYKELGRRELNAIHHEALLEGIEPTFGEVDELVHSTMIKTYNPIEEYFASLPQWDGRDRMTEVAEMVPTDNPYWVRLFRQWMLSMVAHWMNGDERFANSTAPILIGAQGYRKSTFCRQLLPPELQMFYTDSIDFRTNIEAERVLSRFLLVNIDEFDRLSEKQFASVKHLFQKPATNIRRMYSETIGRQRRYASFIGTTNSDEVLRDPTGNRRYLCVRVLAPIKTEHPIDHRQLFAQCVHLINKGERYWLNDEDEALIKETNKEFEYQDSLELLFLSTFKAGTKDNGEFMRAVDIMAELKKNKIFNSRRDNDVLRLGHILSKHIPTKKRFSEGWKYLVKRK